MKNFKNWACRYDLFYFIIIDKKTNEVLYFVTSDNFQENIAIEFTIKHNKNVINVELYPEILLADNDIKEYFKTNYNIDIKDILIVFNNVLDLSSDLSIEQQIQNHINELNQ